jgi:hypothetical protein
MVFRAGSATVLNSSNYSSDDYSIVAACFKAILFTGERG